MRSGLAALAASSGSAMEHVQVLVGGLRVDGGRAARRATRCWPLRSAWAVAAVRRPRRAHGASALGLHGVAAELLAQRGEHLGAVALLLAAAEAGQQRERDDRRRHVEVDRLLDRPAALARVGDPAPDVGEVLAVLLEGERRRAPAATSG